MVSFGKQKHTTLSTKAEGTAYPEVIKLSSYTSLYPAVFLFLVTETKG